MLFYYNILVLLLCSNSMNKKLMQSNWCFKHKYGQLFCSFMLLQLHHYALWPWWHQQRNRGECYSFLFFCKIMEFLLHKHLFNGTFLHWNAWFIKEMMNITVLNWTCCIRWTEHAVIISNMQNSNSDQFDIDCFY